MDVRAFAHPVVLFANGIGDTIMALPALRALTQLWNGELTLIAGPEWQTGVLHELDVRRIVRIALPPLSSGPTPTFDWAAAADAVGPCDLFVSLVPWRSAATGRLI